MTDSLLNTRQRVERSLTRRRAAERRFHAFGLLSVLFGVLTLVVLFADILQKGASTFRQTVVLTQIHLDRDYLGLTSASSDAHIRAADFDGLIKRHLRATIPELTEDSVYELSRLISIGAAWQLSDAVVANPKLLGQTIHVELLTDDEVDQWFKHDRRKGLDGRLSDVQRSWLNEWAENGQLYTRFNRLFFTNGDSQEPELAGIRGAMMGTLLTLMVTLVLSFPIGVATAIYLEQFAPNNKWVHLVEININNLAAVPSITFGLLGLAIFINLFGVTRSTPLIGGLVLTLMALPTIIITARAAIQSVPSSIAEAAYGIGASKVQVVFHHILPLALPGMLTGTLLAMAQALGATAPLLMVGMVAFVADIPSAITDPATVLPVQIFLWADSPERAFVERTSGAILVLLGLLIGMNTLAAILRQRIERRR